MKKDFDSDFYKVILNLLNSNVFITDAKTDEIVYMNDYMKHAYKLENPEGQKCWKVLQKDMKRRCDFCRTGQLEKMERGKVCVWRERNTISKRDYINYDSLQEWNGTLYHVQHSADITERLQLSMEASIDELTGVLNRTAGKKYLGDVLDNLSGDSSCVVAMCDINDLKWVNDTFGHLEGTVCLLLQRRI